MRARVRVRGREHRAGDVPLLSRDTGEEQVVGLHMVSRLYVDCK